MPPRKTAAGGVPPGKKAPGRKRGKGGSTGGRPTMDEWLEKLTEAVKIRTEGGTYDDIVAAGLFTDRSNARKAVIAFLEERATEAVAELRLVQHVRYEALFRDLADLAARQRRFGVMDSTDRLLTLMRDYNKMQGLNAPTRIEVTDEMDREIQLLAAQMVDEDTWDITGIPEGERPAELDEVEER